MKLTFDAISEGIALDVKQGVAPFDPATLLLAAQKGAKENFRVRLRPELDLPVPRSLRSMAKVSFGFDPWGRLSISALIDTGKLKWNLKGDDADDACFEDYSGVERRGVDLGDLPVLTSNEFLVTCAPMKTLAGKPVICWFTVLPGELDEFDGYDLLKLAQSAMKKMHSAPALGGAFVTVRRKT